MAVHSSSFGGLHLSGEDARKFVAQTRTGQSVAVKQTVSRGKELAATLLATGQVKIDSASR
ncbi:hypothetical protein SAMN05518849_1011111 [Sphingobium sp. AP50]|uniref:hypothetical protein n=1 Tax=Sphingobium sp. AP50 TaxID=1884369 RepID=UPI0008CE775E|nr:hypothetical protein [Sphingobium sp. AP50]SEI85168.1 hypothetical protein SAMN05518849_1011111 [Sphingobium sp. AP50]